jgi:hypothetical protein
MAFADRVNGGDPTRNAATSDSGPNAERERRGIIHATNFEDKTAFGFL